MVFNSQIIFSHKMLFVHGLFCPRISRIYTNLCFAFFNGDLFGRTNLTNSMRKFV